MSKINEEYGQIQSVTIEYEKKIIRLTGEDAIKWKSWTDGHAVMSYIHGGNQDPGFTWTTTDKELPASEAPASL